jgi:hypothetical protein
LMQMLDWLIFGTSLNFNHFPFSKKMFCFYFSNVSENQETVSYRFNFIAVSWYFNRTLCEATLTEWLCLFILVKGI